MGVALTKAVFHPPYPPTYDRGLRDLIWIDGRLPAIMLECRSAVPHEVPYTVLFSHGNAEDIGCLSPMLRIIRDYCHVNVLAYEYEGYGLHAGSPTEEKTYRDVRAAFNYLTQQRRLPADRIILFGRSLGTGPTVHLASRLFSTATSSTAAAPASSWFSPTAYCTSRKAPAVAPRVDASQCPAGVVLQSPLTSVVGVVSNIASRVMPGDMFANIHKIDKVQGPVLIMHGTDDRVVPFAHGQALSDKAPNLFRFLALKGAGHNDMEENFTNEYLSNLLQFIQHCDTLRRPAAA